MDEPFDIAAALAAKGWSQSEAARVTNIDRTLINRYCRGLEPPEANTRKLREALGLLSPDGVREPVKVTVSDAA